MNKFARLGIRLALLVVVIFLAYKLYDSIMQPVRYDRLKAERQDVIVDRLQQIRDLQVEYIKMNGAYTSSFDTLKQFFKQGSMPVVYKEVVNQAAVDSLSPEKAIELGFIKTDTMLVPYKDTMFTNVEGFNIDLIDKVPFAKEGVTFDMAADTIKKGNFDVYVFEVKCLMKDYLYDIKNIELRENDINLLEKKDKYPGLKLGSMIEPSLTGNWE